MPLASPPLGAMICPLLSVRVTPPSVTVIVHSREGATSTVSPLAVTAASLAREGRCAAADRARAGCPGLPSVW